MAYDFIHPLLFGGLRPALQPVLRQQHHFLGDEIGQFFRALFRLEPSSAFLLRVGVLSLMPYLPEAVGFAALGTISLSFPLNNLSLLLILEGVFPPDDGEKERV